MAWKITIAGHENLNNEEKRKLEELIISDARSFVEALKMRYGNQITHASVATNTLGTINLNHG